MKVRDLIEKLQEFDGNLPVLAIWNDEFGRGHSDLADGVSLVDFDMIPEVYINNEGGSSGVIIS